MSKTIFVKIFLGFLYQEFILVYLSCQLVSQKKEAMCQSFIICRKCLFYIFLKKIISWLLNFDKTFICWFILTKAIKFLVNQYGGVVYSFYFKENCKISKNDNLESWSKNSALTDWQEKEARINPCLGFVQITKHHVWCFCTNFAFFVWTTKVSSFWVLNFYFDMWPDHSKITYRKSSWYHTW